MRRDDPGPYSLDTLKALAPPALFTRDAGVLKARYVAFFEAASGRTLYPMQVEMLLIEALAYAMALLGEEAQATAEQHFVAFATEGHIERLGVNRSTQRLPAAKALTTLRFTLSGVAGSNFNIPAGTRVGTQAVMFETISAATIRAGLLGVDVPAQAVVAGSAANGLLPGQINTLEQPFEGVSVANLTTSEGGAEIEEIEAYRLRLANAFDRVSSGGGYAWYRETAMGTSSALVDCGVVRPQPCHINLYPLTASGPAGPDLRAAVLAEFNTERALENRFGDEVTVFPPVAVTAAPVLTLQVRGAASTIADDARAAALALLNEWGQRLAPEIAPHDVEARVRALTGVVNATITGLDFAQLDEDEFLALTSLTVNVVVLI